MSFYLDLLSVVQGHTQKFQMGGGGGGGGGGAKSKVICNHKHR